MTGRMCFGHAWRTLKVVLEGIEEPEKVDEYVMKILDQKFELTINEFEQSYCSLVKVRDCNEAPRRILVCF